MLQTKRQGSHNRLQSYKTQTHTTHTKAYTNINSTTSSSFSIWWYVTFFQNIFRRHYTHITHSVNVHAMRPPLPLLTAWRRAKSVFWHTTSNFFSFRIAIILPDNINTTIEKIHTLFNPWKNVAKGSKKVIYSLFLLSLFFSFSLFTFT